MKSWNNFLKYPTTVEPDTIAWLWVAWKLQREDDFRLISALIQKEATDVLQAILEEAKDRYDIALPQGLIGILHLLSIAALPD